MKNNISHRRFSLPVSLVRFSQTGFLALAGVLPIAAIAAPTVPKVTANPSATSLVSPILSLDGTWRIATDPQNIGREQKWYQAPVAGAKTTKVPWIIQDAFPGYHGVAWYWRDFRVGANPHAQGRFLLRFWGVDYKGEVWLNGVPVGGHEGGETPFVLDVTGKLKPNASNRLAVRVLNPTHQPIDGIVLNQTPKQARVMPYGSGAEYNVGGITDSVELLTVPSVRVDDLVARPDAARGRIAVQVRVRNMGSKAVRRLEFSVAPAASGETLGTVVVNRELAPGETVINATLPVANPRRWDLNDPYLYRVTARLTDARSSSLDERSTRCGFRDFRFENGYFRLNGRRVFVRSTHTCNNFPVGLRLPTDPELARRDLIHLKTMGFNMVRFIWGGALRYQLDLCDELGLMVYEESFAAWPIEPSPKMGERYDRSISELVQRDRNHPSIVIWGLLNETGNGPYFDHVAASLPMVRALDNTRMVFLNSGRWDLNDASGGIFDTLDIWHRAVGREPWVTRNAKNTPLDSPFGFAWAPQQVVLHPGLAGEYSVVRWTAPAAGEYKVAATFKGMPTTTQSSGPATTDVHVLRNGKPLLASSLNLDNNPNSANHSGTQTLARGDTIDFVVGWGNENYGSDSTALEAKISAQGGKTFDVSTDFGQTKNPNGPWSYGTLAPGRTPDATKFALFTASNDPARKKQVRVKTGTLANPGSAQWEDVLGDYHMYPRVPHVGSTIQTLRTANSGSNPLFLSEYGIGSAVDLWRATRHFEQMGKTEVEDAQFYRARLDRYLNDWKQWRLEEVFSRPEDFFNQSLRKVADQRTLGLNAIRANPNIVGHNVTGGNDHVSAGEGLTTTFRELKPGTVDALFEAWAPLRLCLFADASVVYRGSNVRLEAVLANEDALLPGTYPIRLQVVGPDQKRVWERTAQVTITDRKSNSEPPLALPIFAGDVAINGPAGKYRFLATFERGGAPTGGEAEFYVDDPAQMPAVAGEVTLWGEDAALSAWLRQNGIRTRAFTAGEALSREVILVSTTPAAPGGARAFAELARRIARGATVIFLAPEVFARGDQPLALLPLANKGAPASIYGWLYLKDEWAKQHPIFDGLPAGGLMDYTYYRDIIPDAVWAGQQPPDEAVAGAIKASQDYASGLMVSVYQLGAGRFILNTLHIRENLGGNPAAERLLRNMLRYGARDAKLPVAALPANFAAQLKEMGLDE